MRRRGQQMRMSSPLVVLLIGLVLILYILFLPPSQREALLSGTQGGGATPGVPGGVYGGGSVPNGPGVLLLDKYVGTLHAQGAVQQEHTLPTTTVFTATNTQEVKFLDSMRITRSVFSETPGKIVFRTDPANAKNHLLTFNVEAASGILTILLNGQPIFQRAITSRSPPPIKLPAEYLKAENTLKFHVGSPGWEFWKANVYKLRNILISADVTQYDSAQSEQHFTLTPEEHEAMERATLEFVPQCDPKQTGRLTITINHQLLYAGFIDCGVLTQQEIPKEELNIGDNLLGFTSSQGSYTLDRLRLITERAKEEYPVFYFNLPPDAFQAANVFVNNVQMTLRFTDGTGVKQGSIIVNGFQDSFTTNSYYYQAMLDPSVLVPGPNSIQIIPEGSSLNIAELRLELV